VFFKGYLPVQTSRAHLVLFFFLALLVPTFGVRPALAEQAAGDAHAWEPALSPHAPACPTLPRLLNSSRLLQTVDLIAVRRFYEMNGQACAWSPVSAAAMSDAISGLADHGFDPEILHKGRLALLEGDPDSMASATRDVLLTDASLKYADYMGGGRGTLTVRDMGAAAYPQASDERIQGLLTALRANLIREWLEALSPSDTAYGLLRQGLSRYQQIAAAGGWEPLPLSLSRARNRDFSGLRTRLHAEGDVDQNDGSPAFDDTLRAGLARFQWRNGLVADGVLRPSTIQRLNISADERVASLVLNLERLRQSLPGLPETRVEVNLPAATAILFRDGRRTLRMNAVIGRPVHETPELSSVIDYIVLNPTWTVPQSIVVNEIRPALRRDPKYLKKNRMRWVRGQVVQSPGPWNALGRVKFDFPNPYSVFLHDTPARALFADPERAASHGCVRLERPVELAEALLRGDPDWDLSAINAAIASGKTRRIRLGKPMPVVLTYQTAFAEADGSIHFRPDVYGRDSKLTLSLSSRGVVSLPLTAP
jgi:murein L,D-transpeptidase YcbB/YkuD